MMEHEAGVSPHVDTSGLDGLDHKLTEAADHMDALGGKSVAPTINSSSVDAYIAKLERAAALERSLGKIGGAGGTSGAVGTSYAATAPTGRQGGPR